MTWPTLAQRLRRSKALRIGLVLIILNELRGLTVVGFILWSYWK